MNIKIKRGSFKITRSKGRSLVTEIFPIAYRYENGHLMAFSFMTELKGK